jgi:iron(III) transport system permease protein
VLLGLLAFVILYPLVLLLINSFLVSRPHHHPTVYGLAAWRFALSDPGMLKALWNTVRVVLAREAISFPVAILVAWLIARTDLRGGKWLELLFWVAFFLPVVPVLDAWVLLAHPSAGLLNLPLQLLLSLDRGPLNIYSFWGIVWVHLMTSSVALKVILLVPALRNVDPALEEASRIAGAGPVHTLLRLTVPLLTPTMLIILMLSLIRSFQSFEIEVLLGLPVRFFIFGSKVLDLTWTEPPMFGAATALSILLLLAMFPFINLQSWTSRRRHYTSLSTQYQPQAVALGRWRGPAFGAVLGLGLLTTAVPVVTLVMGSFMKLFGFFEVPGGIWTLRHWDRVLGDPAFYRGLKNTLVLSFGGASLSAVFLTGLAYVIARSRTRVRAVVDLLTWFPAVLPGISISLAWLWILLQTPFLRPLYGTIFALILVLGLSGVTLGVQVLKAGFLQLAEELEESSYMTGAGRWHTLRRVVMPLLAPTLATVWTIQFVFAAGSAGMLALLTTTANQPLALLQLQSSLSGQRERGAVVGLVVVGLAVGVAVAVRLLASRAGLGRAPAPRRAGPGPLEDRFQEGPELRPRRVLYR